MAAPVTVMPRIEAPPVMATLAGVQAGIGAGLMKCTTSVVSIGPSGLSAASTTSRNAMPFRSAWPATALRRRSSQQR